MIWWLKLFGKDIDGPISGSYCFWWDWKSLTVCRKTSQMGKSTADQAPSIRSNKKCNSQRIVAFCKNGLKSFIRCGLRSDFSLSLTDSPERWLRLWVLSPTGTIIILETKQIVLVRKPERFFLSKCNFGEYYFFLYFFLI